VTALPPLLDGGLNATDTDEPLPDAVPITGAPGAVGPGTTAFDAADGGPVPTLLVAVTVQVYVLPFVNEPTVTGVAEREPVPVAPPFDDVHVAV
jgi:hypothetical protein